MDLSRARSSVLVGCVSLALIGCGGGTEEAADKSSSAEAVAEREQALKQREAELDAREEEQQATERREARERRQAAKERREARARKARRERSAARRRAREREEAQAAAVDSESSSSGGGDITVPDVVGLDHQAAQDALQGEGLYLLDEEDCTGQDRALLFDRNWEVESIDPAVGTQVSADDTITLCSKKEGE